MADIVLSKKEDVCEIEDVRTGTKEKKTVREVEIALLKSIFGIAFSTEKEIKKNLLARDLYEQVENLTDVDEKISLTKEDLEMFSAAWKLADSRPYSWMKCVKLLKQLV